MSSSFLIKKLGLRVGDEVTCLSGGARIYLKPGDLPTRACRLAWYCAVGKSGSLGVAQSPRARLLAHSLQPQVPLIPPCFGVPICKDGKRAPTGTGRRRINVRGRSGNRNSRHPKRLKQAANYFCQLLEFRFPERLLYYDLPQTHKIAVTLNDTLLCLRRLGQIDRVQGRLITFTDGLLFSSAE